MKIFEFLKKHKLKFIFGFLVYSVLLFLLFPFQDLGTFVGTQVAKATQNQVYLKFSDLSLSLVPAPGLIFTNVTVQTTQLPSLQASSLKVYPNILGLLALKPGFSAQAEDIFGGQIGVSLATGGATKSGLSQQQISLDGSEVNLKNIADFLKLPMSLEGFLNLETQIDMDPGFADQPKMNLNLKGSRVSITSAVVPTQFGPLNLPDTKLQDVIAKAVMNNGDLEIERIQIGAPQDELYAQVRGNMKLQFQPQGGQIAAIPGAFDLVVQIQVKPSFQTKAGVFLSFLESYKKSEGNFIFRAQGNNFYGPPRMSPLSAF